MSTSQQINPQMKNSQNSFETQNNGASGSMLLMDFNNSFKSDSENDLNKYYDKNIESKAPIFKHYNENKTNLKLNQNRNLKKESKEENNISLKVS